MLWLEQRFSRGHLSGATMCVFNTQVGHSSKYKQSEAPITLKKTLVYSHK